MAKKEVVTVLYLLLAVIVNVGTLLMGNRFWDDAPRMNVPVLLYQGWLMAATAVVVFGFCLLFWFLLAKEQKTATVLKSEPVVNEEQLRQDLERHKRTFESEMAEMKREPPVPRPPVVRKIPIVVEHEQPVVMKPEELRRMVDEAQQPPPVQEEQEDYDENDNPYREE